MQKLDAPQNFHRHTIKKYFFKKITNFCQKLWKMYDEKKTKAIFLIIYKFYFALRFNFLLFYFLFSNKFQNSSHDGLFTHAILWNKVYTE